MYNRLAIVLISGILVISIGFFTVFHFVYGISDTDNITKSLSISSLNVTTNISDSKLKIALLTDGLFSDAGWAAFGYNSVQLLNLRYGHEIDFKENVDIPNIEMTLRDYASKNYDLIISHGFEWGDPTIKVAKDYPDTKFIVFTGLVNSSNVASIFPMQQEGTYLLGALAAMMSKTKVIGFIGGEKYPNIINIYEGYKRGAADVDPNITLLDIYLDDWDNPIKGKKSANDLINKGADFLLQVADTSGHGVIEAAKTRGIYVFGAVSDQNKLAPNNVLSSFILDVEKSLDSIINMVQYGNFSGQIFKPGLEMNKGAVGDGIVYISSFHSLDKIVPENVKTRIQQLKQDIVNGKIVVPEILR